MNEWISEWMNEWMDKWMNEWIPRIGVMLTLQFLKILAPGSYTVSYKEKHVKASLV